MLARPFRLPATTRLAEIFTIYTEDFVLKVADNNLALSRFGFVVGKRIDKRAVARNRNKRILRSCIEEMLGEIRQGKDMLFFLKRSIMNKRREDLLIELRNIFAQKKLVNNSKNYENSIT